MKIKSIVFLMVCFLMLSGCQKSKKEQIVWWILPQQGNSWIGNKEYQDCEEIHNDIVDQLNEGLEKRGYPYEVVFRYMDTKKLNLKSMNDDEIHEYLQSIKEEQIDIFPVFSRNIEDMTVLNDQFKEGAAKEFYEEMPEKFWDTQRIGGNIYYIPKVCIPAGQKAYYLNKKMIEEYQINIEAFKKDRNAMIPELQKVYEKSKGTVIPFPYSDIKLNEFEFFHDEFTSMSMKMQGSLQLRNVKDTWEVVNFYETAEYKELLQWVERMNQNKLTGSHLIDDDYNKLAENPFMFIGDYYPSVMLENSKLPDDYELIPISNIYAKETGGFAVYRGSDRVEEAVEVISVINMDKELSELFIYGIKGKDYKVENGMAESLDVNKPLPSMISNNNMIGNYLLVTPNVNLPVKAKEIVYDQINKIPIESYQGFIPKVDGEMAKILNEFYMRDSYVFFNKNKDSIQELEKVNKKIEKAGIVKVINELQKQLDNYINQ